MATIVLGVLLIGALLILVVVFTEMVNFVQTRVPFVPTAKADIVDMAKRAGITEQDLFFDLGSGNGKVLFGVEQSTGARTKGFQRGGWMHWYAHLKKWFTSSKVQLVSGNFFDHPWAEATIIYTYLYPFLMVQVGEKALQDCRPGTKIVARDFPILELQPTQTWKTPSGHTMYLYLIK